MTYNGWDMSWRGRQLMEISKNGGQVTYEFTYNDAGIRTSKNVNGSIHHYTLDGSLIASESWGNHFILYLYDESGAPIGLKYRTASYAAGEFDTYFFEKNIFGDIIGVYTEAGVKIGSYTYDAWGNCTVNVESTNTSIQKSVVRNFNPFRYRGYFYDYETGLYYLQSRYYDPVTGRFINVDGYISTGTGLLGYNMYAYCNNNPLMYKDPSGELFITMTVICVIGGALIGAGSGGWLGYEYAQSNGVDEEDQWKYVVGGALIGGTLGGVAGYAATPAITAATGVAGFSITSSGIAAVGTGGMIAGEQVVEGVYYQVTSSQAAQSISQTGTLLPSASEGSVCVLNFQPTLEQAQQLGARSYETVIRFTTNCTSFVADTTVPFPGAYRNYIDGAIKVFEVVEVGFK